MAENRCIVLAERPQGMPTEQHLKLESRPVPEPQEGQVLLRTIYLSLDPYMRGRMSAAKSYAKPVEVGAVMEGGTVCEVAESRHPDWQKGDLVLSYTGWQEWAAVAPEGLRKLDPQVAPISTAVGILGMPGFTAYAGLKEYGRPKEGETLVVSAASGAVGQVVGQMGKILGCHVVGVAGGTEKCEFLVKELGFEAAVDHHKDNFAEDLKAACPDGVDIYWENVAGKVLQGVLPLFNDFARIPVCGLIAYYNMTKPPEGPDQLPGFLRTVLTHRLSVNGFIQFDLLHHQKDFIRDVSGWIKEDRIHYREDVTEGLENAVSAFQGLLTGKNFGKQLVQVSDDPTRS